MSVRFSLADAQISHDEAVMNHGAVRLFSVWENMTSHERKAIRGVLGCKRGFAAVISAFLCAETPSLVLVQNILNMTDDRIGAEDAPKSRYNRPASTPGTGVAINVLATPDCGKVKSPPFY